MCQLKTARISLVKDARIYMNLYFSETVIEFESLNYYIIAIIILDQEPLPGENNRHSGYKCAVMRPENYLQYLT